MGGGVMRTLLTPLDMEISLKKSRGRSWRLWGHQGSRIKKRRAHYIIFPRENFLTHWLFTHGAMCEADAASSEYRLKGGTSCSPPLLLPFSGFKKKGKVEQKRKCGGEGGPNKSLML